MASNTIRFSGLASGLDTESLVKSMIAPQKLKVDRAKQGQTLLEWKKDAWRDLNAKLYSFYNQTMGKSRLEGTFSKMKNSVSDTSVIELGADSRPPEGTHSVIVNRLATSARIETSNITHDKDNNAIAVKGNTALGTLMAFVPAEEEISITITGQADPLKFKSTDTMIDVEKKLKSAMPEWNVNFDDMAGAFFIKSKTTGAAQTLEITGDARGMDFLNTIKVVNNGLKATVEPGQDAQIEYEGITITSSSNNISINGFQMTLKSESPGILGSKTATTIVSTRDKDSVVAFVKEFITEYNKLIEELNAKHDAPSSKGYDPLTEDQKKEMSDSDVQAWEKKIKDSLFRRDTEVKDILDTMRGILSGTVEGNTFKSLSRIGITTGDWTQKGKLQLDEKGEERLRKALDDDPDAVMALFAGNGDGINEQTKGIGDRLYDTFTKRIKSTKLNSATSFYKDKVIDDRIKDIKKQTDILQSRLDKMEDMYYRRFTAMEKMMSQLNNQSNWLAQQMGGMN